MTSSEVDSILADLRGLERRVETLRLEASTAEHRGTEAHFRAVMAQLCAADRQLAGVARALHRTAPADSAAVS